MTERTPTKPQWRRRIEYLQPQDCANLIGAWRDYAVTHPDDRQRWLRLAGQMETMMANQTITYGNPGTRTIELRTGGNSKG